MSDTVNMTDFFYACVEDYFEDIENFLLAGTPVNDPIAENDETDHLGFTPLHVAVFHRNPDSVRVLLRYGADINLKNIEGHTPLHVAFHTKALDMAGPMLEYQREFAGRSLVNSVDRQGVSHFHIACTGENYDVIKAFIWNKVDINAAVNMDFEEWAGYTPLHFAAIDSSPAIVNLLLQHGAAVNARTARGYTPLHVTAQRAKTKLNVHSTDQNQIILQMVLRGCDVNARDIAGCTALHHACRKENTVGVHSLIECGADFDIKDNAGKTPAEHFIEAGQVNPQMTHVLLYYAEILRICGARSIERQNDYVNIHLGNNIPKRFFKKVERNCMTELNSMKTIVIDRMTSLDKIFVKSRNQMSRYVNNTKIQKLGKSTGIEKLFPIYGSLLVRQINKGYARQSCLLPAHGAFAAYGLPYSCVDKVFEYLENDELRNIINAAELVVTNN